MSAEQARQIREPPPGCNGHDKLPGEVRRHLRRRGPHLLGFHSHDDQLAERRGLRRRAEAAHPQLALQALSRLGAHLDDADGPGRDAFFEQAADNGARHIAAADERNVHAFSRSPKIAVPTRTMVAPSAIAASRSADMPIESVSSARPPCTSSSFSSRSVRKRRRCSCASDVGSGTAIRLRSCRRGSAFTCRASGATASGATPLLLASLETLTSMHTWRGGRCAGRASESRLAIFWRSSEWTQWNASAIARVLLLWIGPMKCHTSGRSARTSIFVSASWT